MGLVYLDAHADLNVPSSVPEGALDWMGMAHMLGEEGAAPELVHAGPRAPLLDADQVVLFGWDAGQATDFERAVIERRAVSVVPVAEVAAGPEQAALRAREIVEGRCDRLLVHFDVDVIDFTDFPLSENTGRNEGLAYDDAIRALRALLASPLPRRSHGHRAEPRPRRARRARALRARRRRCVLAPPVRRIGERGWLPAGVGRVEGDARRHDLVDPVERRLIEPELDGAELRLELLHRARPDDRARHGRMLEHEREREVDEADPELLGELRELLGGGELGLVARTRSCRSAGGAAPRGPRSAARRPRGSGR